MPTAREARSRPFHRETIRYPGGAEKHIDTFPVGKAKGLRAYCKYCYSTHSDWWKMDVEEYPEHVYLCGKCEYTSLIEQA